MNPHETRMGLTQLVTQQKVSSILLISEQLGIDEDTTRAYLQELVTDGKLNGYLTDDGSRFFKSDAQVTSAPIVATHKEWIPESHDVKLGKMTFAAGIILFVIGQAVSRIFTNDPLSLGVGGALVMFGYATLIGGLAYIGCKGSE